MISYYSVRSIWDPIWRRYVDFTQPPSYAVSQKITMDDVQYKPDEQLGIELRRLETLATSSEARWKLELFKDNNKGLTETPTVFR